MKINIFVFFMIGILVGCSGSPPKSKEMNEYLQAKSETQSSPAVAAKNTPKNYFEWPVKKARLSRGFMPNRRRPHRGIDLAAPRGTPIYAAHDGRVLYAGDGFTGFGQMILLEGSYGWATLYGHLSKIEVRENDRVHQGDEIGLMGSTGHSTGNHLHFEIRKNKKSVNPILYLPKLKGARSEKVHS